MKRIASFALAAIFLAACSESGPTGLDRTPTLRPAGDLTPASGAWVTTDKADYAPGETVTITGGGFWPGETVDLLIEEEPSTHDPHLFSAVADGDGSFENRDFVIADHDLGVTFTLTAMGQTSGMVAEATFTDANSAINVFSITPTPVGAGEDLTWSASAICTSMSGANSCTNHGTTFNGPVPNGYTINLLQAAGACGTAGQVFVQVASATTTGGTGTAGGTVSASAVPGFYAYRTRHPEQSISGNNWSAVGQGTTPCVTIEVQAGDDEPPEVLDINAVPNPVAITETALYITATISDENTGGSDVTDAEFKISKSSGLAFDSGWMDFDTFTPDVTVNVSKTVNLSALNLPEAGLYDLCVRGEDEHGNQSDGTDCITLVVYDPSAGFVTGGGWIYSADGAYKANITLEGKATFGFVSKYKKGATKPDGSTEFQFRAASFNFHSNNYDWLVVNQAGTNAQYKGKGTINGAGEYWFMLWAVDGSPDQFRIRIWEETGSGEYDIYDNGFNQDINQGSIVIHTGGKNK